jgi:hypothetical protein
MLYPNRFYVRKTPNNSVQVPVTDTERFSIISTTSHANSVILVPLLMQSLSHLLFHYRPLPFDHQRYSDRYRRVDGLRNVVDEMDSLSKSLFPPELIEDIVSKSGNRVGRMGGSYIDYKQTVTIVCATRSLEA